MDAKTVCVIDLISQMIIGQVNHETKIDWMELSETAHKLLFRDKKMRLILIDIYSGKKQTLLNNISFVQWVPQSDVVVAQSNNNLAIWYNIDLAEHLTLMPIRGEAVEVVREGVSHALQEKSFLTLIELLHSCLGPHNSLFAGGPGRTQLSIG